MVDSSQRGKLYFPGALYWNQYSWNCNPFRGCRQDYRYGILCGIQRKSGTDFSPERSVQHCTELQQESSGRQWVLEGRYDGYIDIRRIFDTRVLAEDGEYHQYADKLSYVPYEAIPTWAFFNKNNQELADEFDKAWEEVYEEGTFEELAQKYFGYSLFEYVPEGYKKGDEL